MLLTRMDRIFISSIVLCVIGFGLILYHSIRVAEVKRQSGCEQAWKLTRTSHDSLQVVIACNISQD